MKRPDNYEQQPGRWGSNRFIVILVGIIIGVVLVNLVSNWMPGSMTNELQTPSGTSRDQPGDGPPAR